MSNEATDLIKERYRKLEAIQKMGIEPFGGYFPKKKLIADLLKEFKEGESVQTAGRLTATRFMGKSVFCDLKDESGKVQLYIKKDNLTNPQDFELFENFDIGDIIGIKGEFFKTKTGEQSLKVSEIKILSKSLKPMPEKWHGLKDVEIRYRQRYLDLISNDETKEIFKKRSKVIRTIRNFLDDKGYLEVETPIMHPIPGGAAGKPFKTHHQALNMPLYLRVAPELYLKKLLVGGFDKVYELNKSFRNEGISTRHNPEFTMLEVYTAYDEVKDVMELTEKLIQHVAMKLYGTLQLEFGDTKVNLENFQRVSFAKLMKEQFDISPEDDTKSWVEKLAKKGHKFDGDISRSRLINIVGEIISPETEQSKKENHPVFVTDYFTELCPLAKKQKDNPAISERFELYIGGMEVANGYSELNDPIDQRQRLLEELKEKGKESTFETLDEDFLNALENGMPPAGGLGIGIDRLVMVLTGQASIREVILFPQMRNS